MVNIHRLPKIKAFVIYNVNNLPPEYQEKNCYLWKDFLLLGKDVSHEIINAKVQKIRPGTCACLIYTSGTTGKPKACMLSHDNLLWTVESTMSSTFN